MGREAAFTVKENQNDRIDGRDTLQDDRLI